MALLPGVHAQPGALLPAITTTSLRHQRRKRRGSSWDWRSNPKHPENPVSSFNKRSRRIHRSYAAGLSSQLCLSDLDRFKSKSGKEGKAILGVARPLRQDKLATWLRVTW